MQKFRPTSLIILIGLFIFSSACVQLAGNREGLAERTKDEVIRQLVKDKRDLIFEPELIFTSKNSLTLKGVSEKATLRDTLIQALNQLGYSVADSLQLLPIEKFEQTKAQVRLSVANVKAKPSHSSELVTQFLMGHPVHILDEYGGWYRVRGIDHYPGWIEKDAVVLLSEAQKMQWNASAKGMISAETVCRNRAGDVISDLTLGNVVMLGSRRNNQQEIILPDMRRGYIKIDDYEELGEWQRNQIMQLASSTMLEDANELLGRPYVWGGTSMRGMDCSGFTKTVFLQNGWLLPRDASQQVKTGIEVASDTTAFMDLQAGDLLFFGRKGTETQNERIVHVGIALGNGKMIHCAGSVNIESLIAGEADYNAYRARTFVKAKRLLGLENEQGFNWLTASSFEL